MNIQSTKRRSSAPAPKVPGILVGIENPSPELAAKAQSILGLAQPPRSVLLGVPSRTFLAADPFDKALQKTLLATSKLLSKELSRNAHPWVKTGVDVFWLGVKVNDLFEKWQDRERNIPALIVETAGTALGGMKLASGHTGIGEGFFADEGLQERIGVILTGAGAIAKGEDISMALLDDKVASTEFGKFLPLMNPIFQYALSEDPKHSAIQFKPLRDFEKVEEDTP